MSILNNSDINNKCTSNQEEEYLYYHALNVS